ncbi:MAG: tRNA (adenosine(37)-N6)-dimethylallyltransferase MiaA [Candidatus Omnitrophica bacterium]|nr:tRNA (adenosine(37)-N6)-dimethylallyltransferase MiaA [Candidatus Omnitrophota bacterium]MBU1925399.1 tRNA (adenosine(37)-N6)-dimethylallyltransferase MiaA [Candidatus Omnitrophota bacterium]
MSTKLVVFIVGPTASGKSQVALELAKKINAEIISADSMQVYKGMDILSGKLSPARRKGVKHHLIDILKPSEDYNAAMFVERACSLIKDIYKRSKIPLVAGGTGMYVRALLGGMFGQEITDPLLRVELYKRAELEGAVQMYEQLKKLDPQATLEIHPNNLRRVVRALEVNMRQEKRFSELKAGAKGIEREYRIKMFGINWPREKLYQRIEQRVDEMFKAGIVCEVKGLKKIKLSRTAAQALGIKQISAYLNGQCSEEEAKTTLKRDTRRFAKRQMTWFRNQEKDIFWLDVKDEKTTPKHLAQIIAKHLSK